MRIIRVLAVFLLVIFLFFVGATAKAATYYVSAAGSDGAAGTSTGAPWLTVAKVNSTATTGDTVYFRRGDRWREQITVPGSTMTFGAYGTGAAPIIDGANTKTWTNTSGNIWTASVTDDPFFIMFNGTTGTKEANAGAVNAANEWFWTGGTLTVYNVGDPAAVVTVPTREYGIVSHVGGSPKNTITIRDIEFRGARYYNLKNSSGNTWVVENVISDHSGHGGLVFEVVDAITVKYSRVSYANQLGPSAFHEAITLQGGDGFTVQGNTLYNNGEDGITAKYNARNGTIAENVVYNGGTGPSIYVDSANNIVVRGNYLYNSLVADKAGIGLSIEFGANPSNYNLHTVTVVDNVVTGHATGVWIWIEAGAEAFADINNIKIHNNTLVNNDKTNWGGIFVYGDGNATDYGAGNEIRNNIIYGNVGTQIWDIVSGGVVASEFSVTHNLFKSGDTVGVLGTNSVTTADVLFTGLGQGVQVYDLASGSPARNVGATISGTAHVAQEHAADIGAREYFPPALADDATSCTVTGVSNASPPRITCAADPGWSSGQRIRLVNLVTGTNTWSSANGDRYVTKITGTTYDLYSDPARTIPLPAPGVFLNHTAIKWAAGVEEHAFMNTRPRLYSRAFIENVRREVSRGTLTNIVVSGGTATATFANTGTIPHIFKVGGGVGVWGSATSALNTESATVLTSTTTTITWTTAAANGTYTDAMVSAYAHNGNMAWTGIKAACAAYTFYDVPQNTGSYPDLYNQCAMVYYVDRTNTTARDRALWVLDNAVSHMGYGSLTCDETGPEYCGGRDNGVDYTRGFIPGVMRVYDILKSANAVPAATEATFKSQVLTDRTNNPSCVNDPFVQQTGTISASGTTTVTGVGTNFLNYRVGGVIWDHQGYRQEEQIYRIVSIESATSMTLNRAASFSLSPATAPTVGTGWSYYRPWQEGDCGLLWFIRHHNIHTVSNPAMYPAVSNPYFNGWNINNLGYTGAYGEMSIGMAFYGDDVRGNNIVLDNWALVKHHHMATSKATSGDQNQMGGDYGFGGRAIYGPSISDWLDTSFPTVNSMGGYWKGGLIRVAVWGYNGGGDGVAQFTTTGESSVAKNDQFMGQATELAQWVTEDEQRAWQATVARFCGVANAAAVPYTCFPTNNRSSLNMLFNAWNPQLVPNPLTLSTLPKGRINTTSSLSGCEGAYCSNIGVMGEAVSRWDWTQNPVKNWHFCWGPSWNDHHTPCQGNKWLKLGYFANSSVGGEYAFIGTDNPGYPHGTTAYHPEYNSFLVPGTSNWRNTLGGVSPMVKSGVTDDVFWTWIETKDTFGTPLTRAARKMVRFTAAGGQDIMIEDSDNIQPSPGLLRDLTHFSPNGQAGEGSTTCAGVACTADVGLTANLHSENATWRVMMNTVFPDGGGVRRIDLANGSYSGAFGRTFRLVVCASADGNTCNPSATTLRAISAYHVGVLADGTSMTTTSRSVGSWRGITAVANGDTVNAMFSSSDQTSMGAITLPAGKFFILGLAAGVYDVRVDGSVVANNVTVTSTGGAIYVGSLGAGSVDVALDGAPPAAVDVTTTSPLPGGTVAVSYSQSLAATGGVPPFTWSVQSGTLCTGLTLSSAGVVSGTPTTAQTCTFTPQATDTLASTDASPPSLQITIASGVGPVTVITTSLPGGTRGVAYSQTLAATGGTAPYTWSVVSGALCTGLSLSSGGVLSGTPSLAQTCSFTVRATDSVSATDDQALSIVVAAAAFNWYVSASVVTGGAGTIGDPWNFAEVLESPSSSIQPGDTVYLRAGTYVIGRYGPLDTPWRDADIAGASGSPVTIRPYTGETVYIDGGIHFNGGYVVFRDFIVYCSYNTRISAQSGSFPTDMPLPDMGAYAPGIQMINNIIYGLGNGIALWESAPNSLAYGNIILYPGHQGTDRGHGHGFYIQNDTGQHVVENNIVGQTFGMGGQVYGSVAASLNNVKIRKGVFYGGGSMVNNPSRNLLIGGPTGVVATDMELVDSISYGPTTLAGGTNGPEVNLGYWGSPGGGCSNMLVTGLIAITEVAPAISISDGTAAGALCNFNGSTGGNTIYGTNRGLTLPGANTLVNSASRPSTAVVRVFPNTYETGRAHIHVVNWPRNNTVSVDLSSTGLVSGDFFTIRDAQDPLGSPVLVGTYTGSPVTLPMTGTSVLTMAGVTVPFAPVHTDREFGVFLLQKSATPPAAFKSYLRGVMVIRGNTVLR